VTPAKFALQGKWSSQVLVVVGRFADGTARDVTTAAEFKSANAQIAAAGKEGIVQPVADGEAVVSITAKSADTSASAEARVTVKDAKNDSVFFQRDVMPLVDKLGCNQAACHGAERGRGGFKLSMFGAEPEFDYDALTKSAKGRVIDKVDPANSLLLLKATAGVPHAGGAKVQAGSAEYNLLISWIAQGAAWGTEPQPKLVTVKLVPEEQVLPKGEPQQLLAKAIFSDGSEKDVTRCALYKTSEGKVAAMEGSGKVKAEGYGESIIVATYLRQSATARVIVPQPLPTPFPEVKPNNKIDELVFAKLKRLGMPPSEPCADDVFLRRVYLDTTGILPTPDEARAFLADADPQKRGKLIDRLLEREEFADFWTLKWGDLLKIRSEYPVRVWPRAVMTYYQWVRDSIAENKPYDQFVRELLTSSGSNFRDGPSNYYRAVSNKDPQSFVEMTTLTFMGVRLGCAHCHGHPTEKWSFDDNMGMAACFAKIGFKATSEWKEEIVFFNPKGGLWNPRRKEVVKPKFLDGEVVELSPQEDPRIRFSQWLASPQNPWFARNAVNRVWYWLLGRGIVHETDDLRPTNPAENPELLDFLAQQLVGNKYDLKHVFRLILNSKTYQLSSMPNAYNKDDIAHFSHYHVRRLGAEQLLDAISQVTQTWETFAGYVPVPRTLLPQGHRATQVPDSDIPSRFLELFGRALRDRGYEGERTWEPSLRQAMFRICSGEMQNKVAGSQRVQRFLQSNQPDGEIVEDIYLAALSRPPKEAEKKIGLEYLAKNKAARPEAIQDVLWAVLNTKECMFNH